ncbi:hypothetical protein CGRA01v4_13304 [Colletotrichum graminicola]|nr:hypothetical protein CGRA01v4_13304 [Colletotrichum graminicola]
MRHHQSRNDRKRVSHSQSKVNNQQRSEDMWNRLLGPSSSPISSPSGLMVTGQEKGHAKYAQSRQCRDWSQIFPRTMFQVKGRLRD